MISIVFTDAEMRRLRAALGVPPGSPDPAAVDLLAVLAAEDIARAEDARWWFGP